MSRILVCQHVAFEILGTLNPLLRRHGVRIKYVNFGRDPEARPSLDSYEGLVVLGGPMSVNDTERHPHLATEVELIGRALERGLPLLGICLGAQLMARALGAEVRPGPEKEIGWYDVSLAPEARSDRLFAHFGPSVIDLLSAPARGRIGMAWHIEGARPLHRRPLDRGRLRRRPLSSRLVSAILILVV